MCSGPDQSNTSSTTKTSSDNTSNNMDLNKLSSEMSTPFSSLLEYAANNDAEAFKRFVELDLPGIDEPGPWYARKMGSKQITLEERTPLMVAATYGSLDVLKLIVTLPEVDLNKSCGLDKWTALHCAAFGGSVNAIDVIKLLLSAGADPNVTDSNGRRASDVIVAPPKLPAVKSYIEDLLNNNTFDGFVGDCNLHVSISSPVLSSSPEENRSPHSPSGKLLSSTNSVSEKKHYPVDPSLPDIRNSVFSTDEFRMFSFKVRPCSRAYSHDWTECPFVHPGENARRRDPRKFHYSCVPCPDFRKGACRRGDMCEYAHGVFECWLHPAQYRTRLCKDGTSCARQVCFFAHTHDELRPLYVSTGSGLPSPRSSSASGPTFMDMASALSMFPSSPTSAMSPNGMSPAWPQPNVPTLHLPGSNLQSSRLRSSFSARDIIPPPEDLNLLQDYEAQQLVLNDLACFSQPRQNSAMLGCRPKAALTPSNLEELFSAEIGSSPRFSDQFGAAFSPSHKSAVLNQFQQQQHNNVLSPINTNNVFSPRNVEHSLLQGSFSSSPRSMEPGSPMSARLSAIAQRERQQQLQMRSLSSRELGSTHRGAMIGYPPNTGSWASSNNNNNNGKWGSPNGKADWSVGAQRLQRSSSFELKNEGVEGEPDLSWVQSLVKESPPEMADKDKPPAGGPVPSGECLNNNNTNSQTDLLDHSVLGAWLEQMRLDQLVV
ncbi:zinc finger CCCH domain-containing protein 30 [Striga asiatica]|uniref:Zinc finger CCCH domain-containing protein 30 n=1 Tax=Striga asiatica TaxID=4170 RepID=A0A5A7QKD9_STRAF|nr:zinc finger CCCH domain-containing protein 30 [Striga asiatica]